MALLDHTSIRRHGMTAIVAAALTALAVANSGPAWGQDTGDADKSPPANTFHAFLLDDGEFTTIDPPGASGELTVAIGINDHRQIVGYYVDACGTLHGFLRDRKGVFTTIDHPDSPLGTAALDINNRGQIVGTYADAEPTAHGFLLDKGRPSPQSTSRARRTPWRSASTTAARSSASTRTPMPRRLRPSHAAADAGCR